MPSGINQLHRPFEPQEVFCPFLQSVDNIGIATSTADALKLLADPETNIIALTYLRPAEYDLIEQLLLDDRVLIQDGYYGALEDSSNLSDNPYSDTNLHTDSDCKVSQIVANHLIRSGVDPALFDSVALLVSYIASLHRAQSVLFGGNYFKGYYNTELNEVRFPYSCDPHTDSRHPRPGEPDQYWRMVTVLTGEPTILYPNEFVDRDRILEFRRDIRPFINPTTERMPLSQFVSILTGVTSYQEIFEYEHIKFSPGTPLLIRHEEGHLSPNGGIHCGPAFLGIESPKRILLHMDTAQTIHLFHRW